MYRVTIIIHPSLEIPRGRDIQRQEIQLFCGFELNQFMNSRTSHNFYQTEEAGTCAAFIHSFNFDSSAY